MKLQRTYDVLDFHLNKHQLENALNIKNETNWRSYSSDELKNCVNQLCDTLLKQEFNIGDKIIFIPTAATPEVIIADLAFQSIGVIPAFVHATFSKDQLNKIISELNPKLILFGEKYVMNNFSLDGQHGMLIDHLEHENGLFNYKKNDTANRDLIKTIKEGINEEELSVIIYTSGTTDAPKGVMLTHKNLMSNLINFMALVPVDGESKVITYLPYSHILERAAVYAYIALGMRIYSIGDIHSLAESFRDVRPAFFSAVPRIIEKIFEGVQDFKQSRSWFKRNILNWSVRIGSNYKPYKRFNPFYSLFLILAKHIFLRRIRMALGGKLKGVVVGGAHLRPELSRLLAVAGVPVREGYGMTETSPVISINRFEPGMNMYGTVGLPLFNVKVRIENPDQDGEGEIYVKGPSVMKGYYKQPNKTREVLSEDGWLKTGDVGKFINKRFLQITDRKKDIFKTSAGKYIAPGALENYFKDSSWIRQMIIIGFHRPFVTALIYPNFELLKKWAEEQEVHWTSPKYMAHNIKVIKKIESELKVLNSAIPKFKRIEQFKLVDDEWTVANGMLSATLKPIRKKIEGEFSKQIEEMYL